MKLVKNNIFYCGTKDPDRKLFDQLIPLPDGTSYNSYLIKGSEKTALVDTAYSTRVGEFMECLSGVSKIDYVIINHAEGDHTDALPLVLERFPDIKIVTNSVCMNILIDAREIDKERFYVVSDNEELSLGDKTLQFLISPWVHWPDTMFTYAKEDKVLFTTDFLGAHIIEENVYATQSPEYLASAKRYYAEIMMPFRVHCQKHLKKIEELKPEIIAPSHGGVYNNPEFILEAYRRWTSDTPCNKAVLAYVSMYHNSEKAMNYLEERLLEKGVEVYKHNLVSDDLGDYACSLVDAATLVLGASMVLGGAHPSAVYGAYLTNALRPNLKFMGTVGSFAWGGDLFGKVGSLVTLNVEKLDSVLFKGKAKEEDFKKLDALAETIAQKHKGIGIG
ncbi:beta-lactamase domain protein [Candidatus Gastranaerophilus sp. (ex Termes propinquus)]|nr:beta-lactamase domain protein [Candidatus Gastranaerophilus sp. (ex Termes propinquus)]